MSDLKVYKRKLFLLGLVKIPLISFVRPKLISLSEEKAEVKIRLRRRTKNHLNSMYFGVLAVGADVAAGLFAFYHVDKIGKKVSFAFKSMETEFLKRAESDVIFICNDGNLIKQAIIDSDQNQERLNQIVEVIAFNKENERVAVFKMEVSVKVK